MDTKERAVYLASDSASEALHIASQEVGVLTVSLRLERRELGGFQATYTERLSARSERGKRYTQRERWQWERDKLEAEHAELAARLNEVDARRVKLGELLGE